MDADPMTERDAKTRSFINREAESRLDHAEIRASHSYDPKTGEVSRIGFKKRNRKPGRSDRYRGVRIGGQQFLLHRFVWFYLHGVWPDQFIDHVNGNRSDNRLENLRLASRSENGSNFQRKPGRYGYRGVRRAPKSPLRPYFGAVKKDGTIYRSSQFATIEEAARAHDALALTYHGKFAVLNFEESRNG